MTGYAAIKKTALRYLPDDTALFIAANEAQYQWEYTYIGWSAFVYFDPTKARALTMVVVTRRKSSEPPIFDETKHKSYAVGTLDKPDLAKIKAILAKEGPSRSRAASGFKAAWTTKSGDQPLGAVCKKIAGWIKSHPDAKLKNERRHMKRSELRKMVLRLSEAAGFRNEDSGMGEMPQLNMTMDEKKAFLEAVRRFNEYGEKIFREDLDEMVETITKIVETASELTLSEAGDDFDQITVNRHVKSMKESCKVFEKAASELKVLQKRMECAYEDIGQQLDKYYQIGEAIDAAKREERRVMRGAQQK